MATKGSGVNRDLILLWGKGQLEHGDIREYYSVMISLFPLTCKHSRHGTCRAVAVLSCVASLELPVLSDPLDNQCWWETG